MLSSSTLASNDSINAHEPSSPIQWFNDGIGLKIGSKEYTWRLKNIGPNLKCYGGYTVSAIAFASQCLPATAYKYTNETTLASTATSTTGTTSAPPTDANEGSSLSTPAMIGIAAATGICALGSLAFFGRKIYNKCKNNNQQNQNTQITTSQSDDNFIIQDDYEDDAPEEFKDVAHWGLMLDPQLLDCGHNVDKSTLEQLKPNSQGICSCPTCRAPIANKPKQNAELKKRIDEYRDVMTKDTNDILIDIENIESNLPTMKMGR